MISSSFNENSARPSASQIDPKDSAEHFLKSECTHTDGCTLRFFRGTYWSWHDYRWNQIPKDKIQSRVTMYLGNRFTKVTITTIKNVMEFVRAITSVHDKVEMPCWLDHRAGYSIAFSNGIVTLDDLVTEKRDCLRPHSPAWFSQVVLNYEFQPDASCKKWLDMLNKNLEFDCERLNLLQEYAGYCLQHSTEYHAMLMLTGDG